MSSSDRPYRPGRRAWRLAGAAWSVGCALLLALGGCDTSVDFFDEGAGPLPFYVFGSLDASQDTHVVRVEGVRTAPGPAGLPEGTRAVLTGGGAEVVLRDSAAAADGGGTAHLFWGALALEPGVRYTLDVSAPGRRTTTAATQVPAAPDVLRLAEADSLTMTYVYRGLRTIPWSVESVYRVQVQGREAETVSLRQEVLSSVRNGEWTYRLFVEPDLRRLRARLGVEELHIPVTLFAARLRIEQRSEEWDVGDLGAPPEGGFGFLGAVAFFETTLPVNQQSLGRFGFRDAQVDGAP